MSIAYQKEHVELSLATTQLSIDSDSLLELAANGKLRAFVNARAWPVDSKNPVGGFLQLLPDTLREARGHDHVMVNAYTTKNNETVQLSVPQKVLLGMVYFSGDDLRRIQQKYSETGQRATDNEEITLGLLTSFLVHSNPKALQYKGEPNIKAIAEALFQHRANINISERGLSPSSIQHRLSKALQLLKEHQD